MNLKKNSGFSNSQKSSIHDERHNTGLENETSCCTCLWSRNPVKRPTSTGEPRPSGDDPDAQTAKRMFTSRSEAWFSDRHSPPTRPGSPPVRHEDTVFKITPLIYTHRVPACLSLAGCRSM